MNIFLMRLKGIMAARRIKQSDIARMAGISQPTISIWYKRDQWPSADAVRKLAIELQVSTDYLLGVSDQTGGTLSIEERMLLAAVDGFSAKEMVDVISYTGVIRQKHKEGEVND